MEYFFNGKRAEEWYAEAQKFKSLAAEGLKAVGIISSLASWAGDHSPVTKKDIDRSQEAISVCQSFVIKARKAGLRE